jgi:hypothetical protein
MLYDCIIKSSKTLRQRLTEMATVLDKIVSGGQTGADRAALDFAIKHKIPHGGWVPKGRLAEDGQLPKKYKLTEMPTTDYQKRTEQNVIDSDGTVIFSHGRLSGGSAYTEKMAEKHNRQCLHLDLSKYDIFTLALTMINWIHEAEVSTLNVAGPRASKNPTIYKDVMDILESALLLEPKREQLSASPKLTPTTKNRKSKRPATVDEAVYLLMSEMKLRDLTKIAKMPEDDLLNFHFTVGIWIRNNFVYPRNDKLLESCREVSRDKFLHWAQIHMVILKQLWLRLQETHKLKVVK